MAVLLRRFMAASPSLLGPFPVTFTVLWRSAERMWSVWRPRGDPAADVGPEPDIAGKLADYQLKHDRPPAVHDRPRAYLRYAGPGPKARSQGLHRRPSSDSHPLPRCSRTY